jgi:hypothetical protein
MKQMINFKERFSGLKQSGKKMRKKMRLFIFFAGMIAGSFFCMETACQSAGDFISKGDFGVLLMPNAMDGYIGLGGGLSLGRYVSERSYLLLDAGAYGELSKKQETGTFSYKKSDEYGNVYLNDNGVISRSHTFIPVFLSWNLALWLSDNVSFHIGPSIGETVVRAFDSYTVNGKTWEPDEVLGEKSKSSHSKYMALFGIGANADFFFIPLSDNTTFGIGYKYLWNNRKSFENEIYSGATHQISLKILFQNL